MRTECRNEKLVFQACGARQVVAEFETRDRKKAEEIG
jgi:hypothetical protein